MKEDLNQTGQALKEGTNAIVDKVVPSPILYKELIAELRANRSAIETLSSNITVLEFRLREIFHIEPSVG